MKTALDVMCKKRNQEVRNMANALEALPISEKWAERFTAMTIYRTLRKIDDKIPKIINISRIDSPAVATIVEQTNTKLSLEKIEKIATVVTDEHARLKIKNHLLCNSWKEAKKDVNLIIASYEDQVA